MLTHFVEEAYIYCTDFIINLATIFSLSYYEINTIVFCFLYPSLLFGLSFLVVFQKVRLKKLKNRYDEPRWFFASTIWKLPIQSGTKMLSNHIFCDII